MHISHWASKGAFWAKSQRDMNYYWVVSHKGPLCLFRFRCMSPKRCQTMLWQHSWILLIVACTASWSAQWVHDTALWRHSNVWPLFETNNHQNLTRPRSLFGLFCGPRMVWLKTTPRATQFESLICYPMQASLPWTFQYFHNGISEIVITLMTDNVLRVALDCPAWAPVWESYDKIDGMPRHTPIEGYPSKMCEPSWV